MGGARVEWFSAGNEITELAWCWPMNSHTNVFSLSWSKLIVCKRSDSLAKMPHFMWPLHLSVTKQIINSLTWLMLLCQKVSSHYAWALPLDSCEWLISPQHGSPLTKWVDNALTLTCITLLSFSKKILYANIALEYYHGLCINNIGVYHTSCTLFCIVVLISWTIPWWFGTHGDHLFPMPHSLNTLMMSQVY